MEIKDKNVENLIISDEVYVSKRRPKCLKIFEKIKEIAENLKDFMNDKSYS